MPNFARRMLVSFSLTAWVVISLTTLAGATDNRFIEFSGWFGDTESQTYDLDTVQFILPERFSIESTTIGSPDVIRFELKALSHFDLITLGTCGASILVVESSASRLSKLSVSNCRAASA